MRSFMVTQSPAGLAASPRPEFPGKRPALSRRQKAAIIVRLMLKEGAQLSLDALPEAMQMELTHEMGAIRTIDRTTLHAVIDEFMAEVEDLGAAFPGGLEGALDLLDGALSASNLRRLRRETGIVVPGDPWDMIAGLPAERLALLAEHESAEIAAVMLSKLPVTLSAKVLGILPTDRGREIAIAMSGTGKVDPDTVRTIGHALAAQLAEETPPAFDGAPVGRIGEILNSSKPATRDGLLSALGEEDADLTAAVRRRIFTFTDIAARVEPRDIPKITRAIDQELLVTALAVADDRDSASVDFILANMSQRMAGQLRDEIEDRGKVKPDDSEDAKSRIVAAIRDLEQAGELALIDQPG
jgi:flagellar motor switch protein FliG